MTPARPTLQSMTALVTLTGNLHFMHEVPCLHLPSGLVISVPPFPGLQVGLVCMQAHFKTSFDARITHLSKVCLLPQVEHQVEMRGTITRVLRGNRVRLLTGDDQVLIQQTVLSEQNVQPGHTLIGRGTLNAQGQVCIHAWEEHETKKTVSQNSSAPENHPQQNRISEVLASLNGSLARSPAAGLAGGFGPAGHPAGGPKSAEGWGDPQRRTFHGATQSSGGVQGRGGVS